MDLSRFDNWRIHQFIGLVLIAIYISYQIKKKYGNTEAILFFYCLISTGMLFQTNIPFWDHLQINIEATSAATALKLVSMAFLALTYKNWRDYWTQFISLFILIDSILVLKFGFGIFNASSFDTAIIACSMPLMFRPKKNILISLLFIILPIAAIVSVGAKATAWYVLFAQVLALLFKYRKKMYIYYGAIVALIAAVLNKDHLFNSSMRTFHWKNIFAWWSDWVNPFTGSGLGSFEWLGPVSQMRLGQHDSLLLWMHNDYLQMLYECGIIGLVLGLIVWIKVGINAYKKDYLFCTFAGVSVCMLSYYPLHFFLSQLLMLGLFCEVSWNEKEYQTLM